VQLEFVLRELLLQVHLNWTVLVLLELVAQRQVQQESLEQRL
jgi:hypothetical protein